MAIRTIVICDICGNEASDVDPIKNGILYQKYSCDAAGDMDTEDFSLDACIRCWRTLAAEFASELRESMVDIIVKRVMATA